MNLCISGYGLDEAGHVDEYRRKELIFTLWNPAGSVAIDLRSAHLPESLGAPSEDGEENPVNIMVNVDIEDIISLGRALEALRTKK